jgi:hypothetical protein
MRNENKERAAERNPKAPDVDAAPAAPGDLPDNARDEKTMRTEEVTLDLPDVQDIPGQENIIPPRMNEFIDATITSDSDEGLAVFSEDEGTEDE